MPITDLKLWLLAPVIIILSFVPIVQITIADAFVPQLSTIRNSKSFHGLEFNRFTFRESQSSLLSRNSVVRLKMKNERSLIQMSIHYPRKNYLFFRGTKKKFGSNGTVRAHGNAMNSSILHAVKFKDFDEILDVYYDIPILVTFSSNLCGPCRLMKKELDQVRNVMKDRVKIFTIDADRFPQLPSRFSVHGLPCTLLFLKGEPVCRIQGVKQKDDILNQLKKFTKV